MRLSLVIISVLLIPLGYSICEWKYPGNADIIDWWMLRIDIYVIASMFIYISRELKENVKHLNWERMFYYIGTGLVISDIWDRRHNNNRNFTKADIVMVLVTVFIGFRQSFPETYNMHFGNIEKKVLEFLNPLKKLICRLSIKNSKV